MTIIEGLWYYGVFFGGRPLGLGGIIGIFLGEEDIDYIDFFLWDRQYLSRSIQKWFFWDFTEFFGPRQNFGQIFWQIFDFGKSARTNRKIFLIPTNSDGFRTFKKSLPVPINRSIYLLLLFVRNCSMAKSRKCADFGLLLRFSPLKAEFLPKSVQLVFTGLDHLLENILLLH
jgi:hypothetical protein